MNKQMNVGQLIDYLRQFEKDLPVYLAGDTAPDAGEYLVLECIPLDLEEQSMRYGPEHSQNEWES